MISTVVLLVSVGDSKKPPGRKATIRRICAVAKQDPTRMDRFCHSGFAPITSAKASMIP